MTAIKKKLEILCKQPLSIVAKKMNYPDSTILILSGDTKTLNNKYPHIVKALNDCTNQRDKRNIYQYATDLVSSWVFEDLIRKAISKDFNIQLNGSDMRRVILSSNKVKTDSDFTIILPNGNKQQIELLNSYTNFWEENNYIDLRMNKLNKIIQSNSLILAIDIYNKKFMLFDPFYFKSDKIFHKKYNKSVYRLDISSVKRYNLTSVNLIKIIKKHY